MEASIEEGGLTEDLYKSQPENCREPFRYDGRPISLNWVKRILEYDPKEIFEKFRFNKINCHQRYNYPSFEEMFPDREGNCACGCSRPAKKKWHNNECQALAVGVYQILAGISPYIAFILRQYKGDTLCIKCNQEEAMDMDHIHPIKDGGGFSYLNNFQMLCHDCHVVKTREDFGWKKLTRPTNRYIRKGERDESQIKRRGPRKKKES